MEIATESDVVRFLTRALGLGEEGSRVTIEGMGTNFGEFHQIIEIIDRHRTIILSMISLPRPEKKDWMIVLRLKTNNTDQIVSDFKKIGLTVTYVSDSSETVRS